MLFTQNTSLSGGLIKGKKTMSKEKLMECPNCKEPSVVVAKRKGYRVLYCMNRKCGWMRHTTPLQEEVGSGLQREGKLVRILDRGEVRSR